MPEPFGVLFVCTGNICRSPTADGIFRAMAAAEDLADRLRIDSAGTIDYHTGDSPDRRTTEAAKRRGWDLSTLRARQVDESDFQSFDLILAMDRGHLRHLENMSIHFDARADLRMFLDFAADCDELDVPDPYYGGPDGFEHVLDLVEAGSRGLLEHVRQHL